MTANQQVTRFCKENGIRINRAGGIPMLVKADDTFEVFETYSEALAFLTAERNAKRDGRPTKFL